MSTYNVAAYGTRNGEPVRLISTYAGEHFAIDLEFLAKDIPFITDGDWYGYANDTIHFTTTNGTITTPYGYPNTVLGAFAYVAHVYDIRL